MSAVEQVTSMAPQGGAVQTIWMAFARLASRATDRRQCRRTAQELLRLDDRQLKDIGIARYEIPGAAYRLFREQRDLDRRLAMLAIDQIR